MSEVALKYRRSLYFLIILVAGAAGILSRVYTENLPAVLGAYTGDTMWALALFFFIRILFPQVKLFWVAFSALLCSIFIEVSQLSDSPMLESIRDFNVGGLIIGYGFVWSDFICYITGILIGVLISALLKEINM
ncbi:MAG: DUF2809 domain-containing protein [Bacteroidales bacterium]|nr:DUF2809 domain-containing protein [Bacteroidales bacterium]